MKQTCLLYTHEKTISVVLEWPVWCCSSYTKQKVFDDDTTFCLEVPKFLHPALKQKGVFMELDIYDEFATCKCFQYSLSTIHLT